MSALSEAYDIVIRNGRVMDPESGLDAIRSVGVTNGVISYAHLDEEGNSHPRMSGTRSLFNRAKWELSITRTALRAEADAGSVRRLWELE